MPSITFKCPPVLRKALEEAADHDGRNISDFIRQHFAKKLGVAGGTSRRTKREEPALCGAGLETDAAPDPDAAPDFNPKEKETP